MFFRSALLLAAVIACWSAALAQTAIPMTFPALAPFSKYSVKTGSPYSAEEVSENVQTLADGTQITRAQLPVKISRDSLGRVRIERALFYTPIASEAAWAVEITDPVSEVKYVLDVSNKIAHRQRTAVSDAPRKAMKRTPSVEPPEFHREKLGSQTIEGLVAQGTRITTTYPIGSQDNDRPFSVVMESWTSRELGVTLRSKSFDPRYGEHTYKLIHVAVGEPAADLFQIPPDYTIVDEHGAFTITPTL